MDGKTAALPFAGISVTEPIVPMSVRPLRRARVAWGISCVVHSVVLIAALWGSAQAPEPPPPLIRLVFAEPPPPPPAPSSTVAMEKPATQPQAPVAVDKPKVEQPKPVVAKPKEVVRLKIVKKPNKPEAPTPQLQPPPEPTSELVPTETAAVAAPAETTNSAPAAVANGVIGGASGGIAGGVIGSHGREALPVDQVANPPLLLSRVMPEYPRQARLQGVEGLVLLEAILDLEGRIEDEVKILQSIPSLDLAALQAVRRWRFRPARDRENRPVRVILEVPVRFVLK